jgi:chromosome segregation ATPase
MEDYKYQEEKIFNLQLTIQKLEEELQLYRNGTSAAELMELIHEKDVEIEMLSHQNEEKTQKLKRIAKTSSEVLIKHENIQAELQKKQDIIYELEEYSRSLQTTLKEKDDTLKEFKIKHQQHLAEIKEKDSIIGDYELKKWEESEKWETRNKQLEEENKVLQEKYKNLEVKFRTMESTFTEMTASLSEKEYQLQTTQREVPVLKEQIQFFETNIAKYQTMLKENDENIEKLQKRCALLISEKADKLKQLDTERQEMIKNIQQFRVSSFLSSLLFF